MSKPTPALEPVLIVRDDVLKKPLAYRTKALAQPFEDVTLGAQTFQGISLPSGRFLQAAMATAVPGCVPTLSFFRKSPHGQREPNYVHSDEGEGDWTGILYLNPTPPDGDGTSFWTDRQTGARSGAFDVEASHDVDRWVRWRHIDARFNRLLIFQADAFHSRGLIDNFGEGDEARLIQVCFATGGRR